MCDVCVVCVCVYVCVCVACGGRGNQTAFLFSDSNSLECLSLDDVYQSFNLESPVHNYSSSSNMILLNVTSSKSHAASNSSVVTQSRVIEKVREKGGC